MSKIFKFLTFLIMNITPAITCHNSLEDEDKLSIVAPRIIQQDRQNLVDQENCESYYQLANHLIEEGKYKKAIVWYTKAADQEHTPSQHQLGCLYANGLGIQRDINRAIKWYTQAAKSGDTESQYALGILYASIDNIDLSKKWYKIAAKNNYFDAQD